MSAAVSPAKLRKAQRLAHLLAAAGLLGCVYAPLETELRDVVRFAVFPALALTGIAMWQAPASAGCPGAPDAPPTARSITPATRGRNGQMQLRELDEHVTYATQLQEEDGPVVLINVFTVAPEDAERLLEAWTDDAAFMKRQPGFISTQLHRGTAGSSTFVNVAEWESARALGQAFRSPEFQARIAHYPDSAVASPHVFERIGVPGI